MSNDNKDYGKYGMMRLKYLKENRPVLYSSMLSSGELPRHLIDINARASTEVESIVADLKKKNPPPAAKPSTNVPTCYVSSEWVAHMNALKAQAEEIVKNTLIYV